MKSEPTIKPPRAAAPAPPAPTCPGLTRAGQPCRATPTADGWCPNHSSRFTAADRSTWGKRGALSNLQKQALKRVQAAAPALPEAAPSFVTAATVRAYLERCSAKVEANQLAPSCAGAIARFAELAIRLAELQLERETLDAEVAAQERDKDRGQRVRVR